MASFVSLTRLRIRFRTLPTPVRAAYFPLSPAGAERFRLLRGHYTGGSGADLLDYDRLGEPGTHEGLHGCGAACARDAFLLHWCDEASVAHWSQTDASLPSWSDADARMRTIGRPSKVLHPTAAHASLSYRTPRTQYSGPIRAAGRARG